MKPISGLLEKIPHKGLRRVVSLAGMLAFSLLLGFILERTLNPEALKGAKQAQDQWIADIGSLTPMGLVDGYLGDIGAAASGKWFYEPPAKPPKPKSKLGPIPPTAEELACEAARALRASQPPCKSLLSGSLAACETGERSDPECTAYIACRAKELTMLTEPFECFNIRKNSPLQLPLQDSPLLAQANAPVSPSAQIHPILIPLAAIVHGVTRIIDGGLWAILLAVVQLGVGFVLFLVLTPLLNKSREPGFGDGWMNYILGPITIILLGSLVALVLQGIMLGALSLFSWITGFAAAAAGATGIVGGAWWSAQKLAEKGIEEAVTKRV